MPGPLSPYAIVVNGVESTLLLDDHDAKARGLLKVPAATRVTAANKSRTAANKSRTAANN